MKATLQQITPARAAELLKRNDGNRKLRPGIVKQYAEAMTSGQWKINGETIVLNGSKLLNGQHRLTACVKAGVPFHTFVVEGVSAEAFDTFDTGRKRTAGDALSILGEKDANTIAAALALVDKYMTGRLLTQKRYTNTQICDLLEKYPGIRDHAGNRNLRGGLFHRSNGIALSYLFSLSDAEANEAFWADLASGAALEDGDPVLTLRNTLIKNSLSKAKLRREDLMTMIIRAWNHRRDGNKIKFLRIRNAGSQEETVPLIK